MATLFSDLLTALGVKHTEAYSDRRFNEMPFQTMFGLSNLLREYGVGATGVSVAKEALDDALRGFVTPFLADTADGFVIVTDVTDNQVTYLSQQRRFTVAIEELIDAWNGTALLVAPGRLSIEPEYTRHRIGEIFEGVKRWTLGALAVALVVVAMWLTGLYCEWSAWVLLALDCAGLWLSWMLVQKSLGIHTQAADAVCAVLEEGGCDELARSEASSFMGIFKWSEVGLAYFSISMLALLLFPRTLPALAAINILCLPYTVWSITYQRFKAKVWCTMCVGVQLTLWLLAAVYLIGGWDKGIFSGDFWTVFFILGAVYIAALLAINALNEAISRTFKVNDNGHP